MSNVMKEIEKSLGHESQASRNKRKWIRCKDGVEIYSIGKTTLLKLAREAGAAVQIDRTVLIDAEKFDMYLETFRLPGGVL